MAGSTDTGYREVTHGPTLPAKLLGRTAPPSSIAAMLALAGPFFMFSTLLVISGAPKLVDPRSTSRALEAIGLPPHLWLGRLVGAIEIAVGLGALAFGGRLMAGGVTLLYTGFAGFIFVALRTDRVKSCGCFGAADSPPSRLHLVIDLAAAATAGALVVSPIGDIVAVMRATPWGGVPLLVLVVVGAWLSLLVLTLLPAVFAEIRAPGRAT